MSEGMLPAALCIMGPTAAGKTDLAVALAERFPVRLISVDSALVYRQMDIGTAKPDPEVLARAPHRLIDILDPAESYSAARFRADALVQMNEARAEGELPVLVGGTLLYYQALIEGLSPLPESDPALRAQLSAQAEEQGYAALHARLAEVDPASAARIHPNDPQRLLRAMEVYLLSGEPLTKLWGQAKLQAPGFRFLKVAVAPQEREWLRQRIALRYHQMLERGFVAEVERLRARGDLHAELPAMRAVGYRQVWSYLDGEMGYDEMVERGIIATRQYAKRQFTWLRREERLNWLESRDTNRFDGLLKILADNAIQIPGGAVLD